MKKIAFVFPALLPMPAVKGGATETLIQSLIDDNEKRQECQFDVYCRFDAEAEKVAEKYKCTRFFYIKDVGKLAYLWFRLRRKLSRGYVPEPYLTKIGKLILENQYDYIVVQSAIRFLPYLKKHSGTKTLLHLHFDGVNSNQPNKQEAFNCCDGVICVSQFIERTVRDYTPSTKTCVLQNVIDTTLFDRRKHLEEAEELRKKYAIEQTDKVVVYAGRLLQVKGVLELVKAFNIAKRELPNLKLFLIGSAEYGETVKDEYYKQLRAEVEKVSPESVVMTGYIPHSQIADFYAMADIAVMPTIGVEEASGLSALEPLSAGCCFIGSDSGGIPEVANCSAATIVPRGEEFVQHLAEEICRRVLEENQHHQDGRTHVLSNHDASQYYDNFLDCLQELV